MKDSRCSRSELYNEEILPDTLSAEVHAVLMVFKIMNNLVVNNNALIHQNQIHTHATRNANNFVIPHVCTQFASNNFYIRAFQNYNNLPNEL